MDDGRTPSSANSKERQKALAAALSQIEKQFGKGSIMRLAEGAVVEDVQVVLPAPWVWISRSAWAVCRVES